MSLGYAYNFVVLIYLLFVCVYCCIHTYSHSRFIDKLSLCVFVNLIYCIIEHGGEIFDDQSVEEGSKGDKSVDNDQSLDTFSKGDKSVFASDQSADD